MRYSYHICDGTGHKIIDCPKYSDMKNMFKNKIDAPPSSLMDSATNPKKKTTKGQRVGARSLACNTSRVEGCARAPG
jgi:hypothetical protein